MEWLLREKSVRNIIGAALVFGIPASAAFVVGGLLTSNMQLIVTGTQLTLTAGILFVGYETLLVNRNLAKSSESLARLAEVAEVRQLPRLEIISARTNVDRPDQSPIRLEVLNSGGSDTGIRRVTVRVETSPDDWQEYEVRNLSPKATETEPIPEGVVRSRRRGVFHGYVPGELPHPKENPVIRVRLEPVIGDGDECVAHHG